MHNWVILFVSLSLYLGFSQVVSKLFKVITQVPRWQQNGQEIRLIYKGKGVYYKRIIQKDDNITDS